MNGAFLIDLYDTLVDGDWRWWRAALSAHLGIPEDAVGDAFRRTRPSRNTGTYADQEGDLAAVLETAGIDPAPGLIRDLVEAERSFSAERVSPFPDALETVAALRASGARTALISNCSHNTTVVVERLGLEEVFDAVVLSFRVGAAKPEPRIYEAALEALGVAASEAIFVDDQVAYCDGAAALGIDTRLMLRPSADPPDELSHAVGHRTIERLSDLLIPLEGDPGRT